MYSRGPVYFPGAGLCTGKFFLLVVRNTDLLIVLLVRMAVSPATFGQNTDVGNGQVCTNTDVGKIRTGNQNTGEAGKHVPKLQHKIFKVPELRTSLVGPPYYEFG